MGRIVPFRSCLSFPGNGSSAAALIPLRENSRGMTERQIINRGILPVLLAAVWLMVPAGRAHPAAAYEAAPVTDPARLTGHITFSGEPAEPLIFKLKNFPNERYCRKISDGQGNRIVQEVRVNGNGVLQDAVVAITGIQRGKPFDFKGTDVTAHNCQFLVQGGPSTFTGVVVRNSEIRLLNLDSDPKDPALSLGIAHNPHSFEISNFRVRTLFKVPLPFKGQVIKKKVALKQPHSFIKMECDIHDFMEVYFLPVDNPYYAIVDQNGAYTIDGIPPGTYKLAAWHPLLGRVEREITVLPGETQKQDFLFTPGLNGETAK
jgi:hypothetical protein